MLSRSMVWWWLLFGSLNMGKRCDEFTVLSLSTQHHLRPLLCCFLIVRKKTAIFFPVWFRVKVFQWQTEESSVRQLRWLAEVLGGEKFSRRAMYCGQAAETFGSSCYWLWDSLLRTTCFGASGSWSLGGSFPGSPAPPDFLKADFPSPIQMSCTALN